MSTEDQARNLMTRHHHIVKNRQQSLLNRVAAEVGMDDVEYRGHIQGKPMSNSEGNYDRRLASMS
jgi:hypothetical protein